MAARRLVGNRGILVVHPLRKYVVAERRLRSSVMNGIGADCSYRLPGGRRARITFPIVMIRVRNLGLAWLVCVALQLVLLSVPGDSARPGIGDRGTRFQSDAQSTLLGKRLLAPELAQRHAQTTPFAPSIPIGLDLPVLAGTDLPAARTPSVPMADPAVFAPARAPPALL